MIKANALNNTEYKGKNRADGHSLFLYELNVIETKAFLHREFIYNFNRNTINTMNSNPYLNINFKFNSIGIEYVEGEENFWEFLTYVLGMTGGIISMVRITFNLIYKWVFGEKKVEDIPMETK